MFERDMLDLQQKYNVEVRYTNYVDSDLKYEMRARFETATSTNCHNKSSTAVCQR